MRSPDPNLAMMDASCEASRHQICTQILVRTDSLRHLRDAHLSRDPAKDSDGLTPLAMAPLPIISYDVPDDLDAQQLGLWAHGLCARNPGAALAFTLSNRRHTSHEVSKPALDSPSLHTPMQPYVLVYTAVAYLTSWTAVARTSSLPLAPIFRRFT